MLGGIVNKITSGVSSAVSGAVSTVSNAVKSVPGVSQAASAVTGVKNQVSQAAGSVLGKSSSGTIKNPVEVNAASTVTASATAAAGGVMATVGAQAARNLTPAGQVAGEMSTYNYKFYNDDKQTDKETEDSKTGNCCDLAQVTEKKFEEKGIEAEVRFGNVKTESYDGGHYWVRYKDESGQWQRFDPTAAAENHSADSGFTGLNGTYSGERPAQL